MEYKSINNNDSGLLARTKINEMFRELIVGNEGILNVWKRLIEVNNSGIENSDEIKALHEELKNSIFSAMDHTDREINNVLSYINGMDGGVNGFAEDTSYEPNFPLDKAATVIGLGPGTFEHFLDEEGNPITIDGTEIVILYKGSGVTFWKYVTIIPEIVMNEVTTEFGDSTEKVIAQEFFTRIAKGVINGKIDIENSGVLDDYKSEDKCGLYALTKNSKIVGHALVTMSSSSSVVYQIIFGGFRIGEDGLQYGNDSTLTMIWRMYNVSSLSAGSLERSSWSKWKHFNESFMAVMSEDEYGTLKENGQVDRDCMYYLFEEE